MSKLSLGLVGLPNVGKSTLFNALLKKQIALAANYPFATIEPNVGVVDVPDPRLHVLAHLVQTEKVVPALVEFYDIAGLVGGASNGEGLGNKFLSHIREVAAIVHVIRAFQGDTLHVLNTVDPRRDREIIEGELILADIQTLEKQTDRKQKELSTLAHNLIQHLGTGNMARSYPFTSEEILLIQPIHLLTMKPIIYVVNIDEAQLQDVQYTLGLPNEICLNAQIESDLAGFTDTEASALLNTYGLQQSGLYRLIQQAYTTLNLQSFLTAGPKEVRAWTIPVGTRAPQAAGVIHTDFEKKFIKADVVKYAHFIQEGGWIACRDKGLVASCGKEYVMQPDDIVDFKIGA